MKKTLLASFFAFAFAAQAETVTLTGSGTTTAQIAAIANGATVAVSPEAQARAEKSFATLLNAAKTGQPIYGFTVGVGWNKDREFVSVDGKLDDELVKASKDFNKGLVRAHVGAVGDALDERTVAAIMAIRLNMVLSGTPGMQPAFVQTYLDLLNHDITPVIPGKGSIGQADITTLGHLALNMIGEGEVIHQGKRQAAEEVFKATGIVAVEPYGKDALALLATNAHSLGIAVLAVEDLRQLTEVQNLVYALSLEALDGNVSPILADNVAAKGYPAGKKTAEAMRAALSGSYLWQPSETRAVQDPLSFRDAVWILSTLDEMRERAAGKLAIQLNHSDDNPTVVPDVATDSDSPEVQKRYVKDGGALFSSSNFDPTPWVIDLEATTIALAHSANASVQRILKLNDPAFTHLTRFLGTDTTYHAFGAMEKPPVMLAREVQMLAQPASVASMAVAGNIEDVATNAPLAAERLRQAVDNYAYILGMELIHAAQAIDLRLKANPELTLGKETRALYDAFRKEVAFMDVDRPLSDDFEKAKAFITKYMQK
ncbi:MAG: aromatic amino acid ammonia-lyase [Cardiobacteriaceae bacterium]|nr:aromatic amino acid ammonia-lyase [Cardiobacteriaceae bacterium]